MDDSVAVLDLLAESHGLVLVHRPNLIESLFIGFLKTLKLFLEQKEFSGVLFVVFGQHFVLLGFADGQSFIFILDILDDISVISLLSIQALDCAGVHCFSLYKNFMVEI